MQYNFKWNNKKAKTNASKHKVKFATEAEVFLDARQITLFDDENSETDEERLGHHR